MAAGFNNCQVEAIQSLPLDNILKIILIIELQKFFFSVREIHIFVIPKL